MAVRSLHRATALTCAAALAVVLAACSTSGSDDAADTTTTESSASSTEATTTTTAAERDPEEVAEAEDLADSINLELADFAAGWTEEPAEDSDEGNECLTEVDIDAVKVASVDSPTFSIQTDDGAQAQVSQTSTAVFEDDEAAEAVLAEIAGDAFAACSDETLLDSFDEGGNEVTSDGLTSTGEIGGLGQEDGGVEGTITLTADDGTELAGEVALHFIRTDNVVTAVTLIDIGSLAFEDTLQGLLAEISSNQADALN